MSDIVSSNSPQDNPTYIVIPLTKGLQAFIDKEDADLALYPWCADTAQGKSRFYAVRRTSIQKIRLHRVVMERALGRELTDREQVDHIDRNGLNNRRFNLRLATHTQNAHNRPAQQNNIGGYKGVHLSGKTWVAKINVNKRFIYLGRYPDAISAAKAYNEAAIRYHGEYAYLNEIPDKP